jgi:uncharacterized protein (DUF2225 family)
MPRFSDDLNDNLRDYAEDAEAMGFDELVKQIEDDEDDEMMLALGPRAFGPDSDDCDGLFYWDLK